MVAVPTAKALGASSTAIRWRVVWFAAIEHLRKEHRTNSPNSHQNQRTREVTLPTRKAMPTKCQHHHKRVDLYHYGNCNNQNTECDGFQVPKGRYLLAIRRQPTATTTTTRSTRHPITNAHLQVDSCWHHANVAPVRSLILSPIPPRCGSQEPS